MAAYVAMRCLASRYGGGWRGQAADLFLVPVGAPLWLWGERRLGWRTHDGVPTVAEVLFLLTTWSVAAEGLAPVLFASATGDARDVVAYALGSALALAAWRLP